MPSVTKAPGLSPSLRPIGWIGGWSIAPEIHPFRECVAESRPFPVIPVDIAQCRTAEAFRAVVEDAVRAAAFRYGKINVVAWSMGTLLALELAARRPDFIHRMVLISATPRFTRTLESDWLLGFPAPRLETLKQTVLRHRTEILGEFHRLTLASGSPVGARTPPENFIPGESPWPLDSLVAGLEFLQFADVRALAQDVRIPTLMIHGSDDPICPVEGGRWLAKHLPDATWIEVRGAGHVPFWGGDSALLETIEEFLARP